MLSLITAFMLIQPYQGSIPTEEVKAVVEIVTVMSESNLLSLASKRKYLLRVGKKIEHLHPLDFLKVAAISKPVLEHLRNIQKSTVKWKAFVSGISKGFEEVCRKENFESELKDFCLTLKISNEELSEIGKKKDWENFVRTVIRQAHVGMDPILDDNKSFAALPVNPK